MQAVTREEILPIGEYERIRPHFRARVIEAKKLRRIKPSDILSVVFENHDTVLLQIQEMLRTERITSEQGIQHELETYNELLPGPGQLSATLFVEIGDPVERDEMLVALAGLDRHVALEVAGRRFPATSKERSVEGYGRTTAVHYLKIDLDDEARAALLTGAATVAFVVDHPAHQARVELDPETVRSIADDLRP
jgi:hypothetical protein